MAEWIQVVLRTLAALVALFVLTRFVLGKRQITQLTYFEYITGITIGSLAAVISLDLDSEWHQGLISLLVWVAVMIVLEWSGLKTKKIRDVIDGKGVVLIKDGKVLEDNLKKVRYSTDDLMEQLRKKDVFQVADVEFSILETSGDLSVLLKKENQPMTPKHLGMKMPNEQEPQVVIMDGRVINEGLATIGFNQAWLFTELEKQGLSVDNVFLGQVNAYGELFVDVYDDKLKIAAPSNRTLLNATLKKCIADMELFALSTQNTDARSMYEQCGKQLRKIWRDTYPFLK